jgi:hypothetical protein
MFFARVLLWMSGAVVAGFSFAQTPPPRPVQLATVVVRGAANPERIRYSDLLAGVDAFNKYRHYAPAAALSFFLLDEKPAAPTAPAVSLVLRTDAKDIAVPVATDGKFDLPTTAQVGGKDGYLVANRAARTVGVEPTVRSTADTDTAIRLGDLRLQCEVSWAIEKQNVPKSVRSFFFLGGGMCHSSKIAVNYFHGKHQLAAAMLSDKGKRIPLKILRDGVTYWVPLGDTSWPDDADVTLIFANTPAPNTTP